MNNKSTHKIALITGATSGIGKSTAEIFAKNGINLIICGRREERLLELKNKLSKFVKVHHLAFDVRSKEKVFESIKSLPKEFATIDILINNAGNAHGMHSFEDADLNDFEMMIDINLKGVIYVSKIVVPQMIERKTGHIINIGSIAGKEVYPNGQVYCASKHAVDALSEGMRIDLHKHNIKVSAIHPGLVNTEFSLVRFKGDSERASAVYKGYQPLNAEDVADAIYFMVSRPSHVNIADMIIFPTAQANSTIVKKEV
ncbi:MAG: SDR family NAD(P)-dependent oxidoreductase [Oligoflexia bacterium]|nr:SDR family NAD(P)-dependent oxidoreductase [Oligoflexia bacterium]